MLAASPPLADGLTLATTIGLPVIRGPAVYAKTMATLDHLSGGRVIAGVAPGRRPTTTPSHVAELVARYRDVGLQRMFVWPIGDDPVEQPQRFADAAL